MQIPSFNVYAKMRRRGRPLKPRMLYAAEGNGNALLFGFYFTCLGRLMERERERERERVVKNKLPGARFSRSLCLRFELVWLVARAKVHFFLTREMAPKAPRFFKNSETGISVVFCRQRKPCPYQGCKFCTCCIQKSKSAIKFKSRRF